MLTQVTKNRRGSNTRSTESGNRNFNDEKIKTIPPLALKNRIIQLLE